MGTWGLVVMVPVKKGQSTYIMSVLRTGILNNSDMGRRTSAMSV